MRASLYQKIAKAKQDRKDEEKEKKGNNAVDNRHK
jgi:hypothetical protein